MAKHFQATLNFTSDPPQGLCAACRFPRNLAARFSIALRHYVLILPSIAILRWHRRASAAIAGTSGRVARD